MKLHFENDCVWLGHHFRYDMQAAGVRCRYCGLFVSDAEREMDADEGALKHREDKTSVAAPRRGDA